MAAGSFLHAFGASERLLINRDVLSCGPLPRSIRTSMWQKVRLDFWRSTLAHLRDFNFEPSPIDLLKNANRLCDKDVPCVWAATGNSDQLTISFVLHQVVVCGGNVNDVHVVQFEKYPDSEQRVRGTGELSADQLRTHPEPRRLSAVELACLSRRVGCGHGSGAARPSRVSPRAIPTRPGIFATPSSKFMRRYPSLASGLNSLGPPSARGREDLWPESRRAFSRTPSKPCSRMATWSAISIMASRLLAMSNPALPSPLLNFSGSRQHVESCRGDADGIRRAGVERRRVRIPRESDRRLGGRRPPVVVERQSLVQRRRRHHSRLIQAASSIRSRNVISPQLSRHASSIVLLMVSTAGILRLRQPTWPAFSLRAMSTIS